jgi:hypothetical protein
VVLRLAFHPGTEGFKPIKRWPHDFRKHQESRHGQAGPACGIDPGGGIPARHRFSKVEPGRIEIDGNAIFALIQEYQTVPSEEKKPEAHRKYIDVQYVFQGSEIIGYGLESPLLRTGRPKRTCSSTDTDRFQAKWISS